MFSNISCLRGLLGVSNPGLKFWKTKLRMPSLVVFQSLKSTVGSDTLGLCVPGLRRWRN